VAVIAALLPIGEEHLNVAPPSRDILLDRIEQDNEEFN
jgi:hypothetical protein